MAVAIPALIVAGVTYRDQQDINRTQLEMAQLERDRYEQRYASRVAFWWLTYPTTGGQPGRLKLQNRSPVPIRAINLIAVATSGQPTPQPQVYSLLTDAPPCVVLTLSLQTLPSDEEFWRRRDPDVGVQFTDPTRSWFLSRTGLEHDSGDLIFATFPLNVLATEVPGTRESAGDCGEGG
ncbi:hypothetical protein OOJ91_34190 [Micromonospora lupini]|nr:hypothetical protein [Micromonospora lupini]